MQFRLLFLVFLGACAQLSAQSHWQLTTDAAVALPTTAEVEFSLSDYQVLDLDAPALRKQLAAAPREGATGKTPLYVTLPGPTGQPQRLQVVDSPVFDAELATKYPQFKSYIVWGEGISGRLAVSPQGVHAILHSPDRDYFIEPYARGADRFHVLYAAAATDLLAGQELHCGVSEDHLGVFTPHGDRPPRARRKSGGAPIELRVYDLALASTGEFAQQKGGTKEDVLNAFNTALTIVNEIFEREVAVRMQLVAATEDLIFTNPDTDPYPTGTNLGSLLAQNVSVFAEAGVGIDQYDVGHVFTAGCSGGIVGVASELGIICTTQKMEGVTCDYLNNIMEIARGVLPHEIGHQFNVRHSWNNCPTSQQQRAAGSAFEPGSGTTIMSYFGACGAANNVPNEGRSDYYSVGSLDEFIEFSRELTGNTCPTILPTGNTEPEIEWPYSDGFVIPIRTPFELAATATDAEDEGTLTYCWEQYDLGPPTTLGMPEGSAPIFRSFEPRPENNRVFPRIADVVTGTNSSVEVLPTYSRDLTFRMTVRDNHPGAGAAVWEEVAFRATAMAGPFVVTSPNTDSPTWRPGEYREVTWDVANTHLAPVNCQTVNIRLSLDGGFTYPITLVEGAQNTGSAFVSVPDLTGQQMRIRVEAADNVFFDISDQNFRIEPANEPGFALDFTPRFERVCLPEAVNIDFSSAAILGYDQPIELALVSELPDGVTSVFTTNPIAPGESTSLNLSFSEEVALDELLTLTVRAVSGTDTTLRTVALDIIRNDFSAVALTAPAEGVADIGLTTDFAWTTSPFANSYEQQIATSPAFGPDDLVETATDLTEGSYSPTALFVSNQLHFWRIRPVNECGPGPWLEPNTFRTVNEVCTPYTATDTPVNLPGTGGSFTRTSVLFVEDEGTISDVSIPTLRVDYQVVSNVQLTLVSPAGTRVVLYDENCFNTGILDLGFDDAAPDEISCPPDDKVVFQPVESLSAFAGENTFGNWTLEVRVSEVGGSVGSIQNWSIEFCAGRTASNPFVVRNDTLDVPPDGANFILDTDLLVDDDQTGPDELIYTVLTPPAAGELTYQDQPVIAGTQFRQKDINDGGNLKYRHTGAPVEFDRFSFVVEDNEGGYLSRTDFTIHIFEGAISSTEEIDRVTMAWMLYPNPTTGQLTLRLRQAAPALIPVQVIDLQGRRLRQTQFATGQEQLQVDLSGLPTGVYFVRVGTEVRKVQVIR